MTNNSKRITSGRRRTISLETHILVQNIGDHGGTDIPEVIFKAASGRQSIKKGRSKSPALRTALFKDY
jgi:hypothetical protein